MARNQGRFRKLRKLCDGCHQRAERTPCAAANGQPMFPPAAETTHPDLLCQRVRQLVLHVCHSRGAIVADAHLANARLVRGRGFRQAGQQKLPPLVAECAVITDTKPSDMSMAKQLNHVPFLKGGDVSSKSCVPKLRCRMNRLRVLASTGLPMSFSLRVGKLGIRLTLLFPYLTS